MYQVHLVKKNTNMVMMTSNHLYSLQEANEFISTMSSLKNSYMFILNPVQLPVNNNTNQLVLNNELIENTNNVNNDVYLDDILNSINANDNNDVDDIMTYQDGDLEGLKIIKCGRGLFIQPYEGHKDYGEKYYHNGWWMTNGWFFKKQFYQDLINQGAIPEKEVSEELGFPERQPIINENENYNEYDENTSSHSYFCGCTIDKYKKVLFIKCPSNHPDYGEKYYHNGWWNQEREGWFFKIREYQNLLDMGAKPTKRLLTYKFLNMTYSVYNRDYYLLECFSNNKHYKQKYFEGGVWCSDADGWLFSRCEYDEDFFKKKLAFIIEKTE